MIRLPRDMTSDDVTQWLSGGIFLVRTKTDKELVPVEWSGFRDGYVQGVGFDGRMHTAAHYNCYAVWPELGSFNHPRGYAVHISRRVARQYRRTYNSRCVDVHVPWGFRIAQAHGVSVRELSNGSLALPYTGTFPASFDEAEQRIYDGALSVAVTRRLVVAGNRSVDKRMLYVDGVLAGSVVGGELFPVTEQDNVTLLHKLTNGRYKINADLI
jgi:hypothetical protein